MPRWPFTGLKADRVVIKRSPDVVIVTDETSWRGDSRFQGRRSPVIPVHIDIPIVTPGGGRADVVRTGAGALDVYNRGNNPYQMKPSDYMKMRVIARSEKQAAKAKAQQAAQQRMGPLVAASYRGLGTSNFLNGSIPCRY